MLSTWCYTHTEEYHLILKRDKLLPHTMISNDSLMKEARPPKMIHCRTLHKIQEKTNPSTTTEERSVVAWGGGGQEGEEWDREGWEGRMISGHTRKLLGVTYTPHLYQGDGFRRVHVKSKLPKVITLRMLNFSMSTTPQNKAIIKNKTDGLFGQCC